MLNSCGKLRQLIFWKTLRDNGNDDGARCTCSSRGRGRGRGSASAAAAAAAAAAALSLGRSLQSNEESSLKKTRGGMTSGYLSRGGRRCLW